MVEVPGRLFPVDISYESKEPENYIVAAARKVGDFIRKKEEGDILIFMPGMGEINRTISVIEDIIKNNEWDDVELLPLYGSMSPENQLKIFQKMKKRKVIVSTNIAETSLTVPGIKLVIDSGVIKQIQYDEKTGIESLLAVSHAKSGCEQRMGRAGRIESGKCHRLFTESSYQQRPAFQTAEILRSNLSSIVLTMKKMGIENVEDFDFIDKPSPEKFRKAIELLGSLGALDQDGKLTEIGELMAEIPLEPRYSRMLIEADKYNEIEDVALITSFMGAGRAVFVRPREQQYEADTAHREFQQPGSDYLTLLNVWEKYDALRKELELELSIKYDEKLFTELENIKNPKEKFKKKSELTRSYSKRKRRDLKKELNNWAYANFLNSKVLNEVDEIRYQLYDVLRRNKMTITGEGNEVNISKAITAGLIDNFASYQGRYRYGRLRDGLAPVYIHPSSVLMESAPEYLVAGEIVQTSKAFLRNCHEVNLEWLIEVAPHMVETTYGNTVYENQSGEFYKQKSHYLKVNGQSIKQEKVILKNEDLVLHILLNQRDKLIPSELHEKNLDVWEETLDLFSRVGKKIDFENGIFDLYAGLFKGKSFADLEKMQEFAKTVDWALKVEDLVPAADREKILKEYPNEIKLYDKVVPVHYIFGKKSKAYVELDAVDILNLEKELTLPSGDVLLFKIRGEYYEDNENTLDLVNQEYIKDQLNDFDIDALGEEYSYELGDELPELPEKQIFGMDYIEGEDLYIYPSYVYNHPSSNVLEILYTADKTFADIRNKKMEMVLRDFKEAEESKRLRIEEAKQREEDQLKFRGIAKEELAKMEKSLENLQSNERAMDELLGEADLNLDYFNEAMGLIEYQEDNLDDDAKSLYYRAKKLAKKLKNIEEKFLRHNKAANLSSFDKLKAKFRK